MKLIIIPTIMNLDFFLKEEPLDKLVLSYIQIEVRQAASKMKERNKKETILLNSILVDINSQKNGLKNLLTEVKYCLQVNSNDRKFQEKAAKLITEVIKRSRQVLVKAQLDVVEDLVNFSCQKVFIAACGNSFISLLHQICLSMDLNLQKGALLRLIVLLLNPKLLISTYRQETRLWLYKLYLYVLKIYESHGSELFLQISTDKLIEKVVNGGSGEKDPRNIGFVFQLYLKVFSLFSESELSKYKTTMFENLESYYPIQFVGDQDNKDHQKIDVNQISALLDQCLTHRLFKNEAWELFSTKTAAPPISPFVSTFLLYLSKRRIDSDYDFLAFRLKNLLVRLSEDQFIEQDYPSNQQTLGSVYVKILDFLFCRDDHSFDPDAYGVVLTWLQRMIDRLLVGSCKNSGTMMSIFRCIVKNSTVCKFKTLIEMFRNYALRRVIKVLNNDEQIIPKLGLTIVALSQNNFVSVELEQIVSLLILRVGKLYQQVNDEIKMLLLKILLEAYRGFPCRRLMIRTTNDSLILKDCLSRAKWAFSNPLNQTQSYIIKAFIDFISTVYINKLEDLLQCIEGSNFQLETYLIGRIYQVLCHQKEDLQNEANKGLILEKNNILSANLSNEDQRDGMVIALKNIEYRSCFKLISQTKWPHNQQIAKLLINILIELKSHFSKAIEEQSIENWPKQLNENRILLYLLNFPQKNPSQNTLLQQLWTQFGGQSSQIIFPSISQFHQLNLFQFNFESSFSKGYEPTLVQFCWQHLKSIASESVRQAKAVVLLQYLPEKLLLRDSQMILQLLLKTDIQGSSLLKIVNHLQVQTLEKTGIVQYCLEYIQDLYDEKTSIHNNTEKNVCILAVLISVLEKDKGGKLKMTLATMKKQWKKILMNRKRPIRQAVRKILLMLQE